MTRLAIVVSHPIQHFCPQYASFAKLPGIEIKVFFGSRLGVDDYKDEQFDTTIKWENLYLEEFDHLFLNNEVLQADKNLDSLKLDTELEAFDPGYIIVYGYFQKLQKRAYNWALKNNRKLLYISDSELLRDRRVGVTYLKKFNLNKYFKNIDAFLTVGDANENYYNYYGVPLDKMYRTFFPIDIVSFNKKDEHSSRTLIQNLYQLTDEDFMICTVGKLIDFKRHVDVINALKLLETKSKRRIIYFALGNGPEMENLQDLSKSLKFHKVIFTGFTKPEELINYYYSADLYIHPSEIEAHSLAISEAIYAGCPVLISDKCGSYGPTDDVQNGRNGFVYRCGDISQLTELILLLLNDNELREKFSSQASAMAVNNQQLAHGMGLLYAIKATQYN